MNICRKLLILGNDEIQDFVRKGRKVEKKGRKAKLYAVSFLCVLSVPLRPLRTKKVLHTASLCPCRVVGRVTKVNAAEGGSGTLSRWRLSNPDAQGGKFKLRFPDPYRSS